MVGHMGEGLQGGHAQESDAWVGSEESADVVVGIFIVFAFAGNGRAAKRIVYGQGPGVDEVEVCVREKCMELLRRFSFIDADLDNGAHLYIEGPCEEAQAARSMVNST